MPDVAVKEARPYFFAKRHVVLLTIVDKMLITFFKDGHRRKKFGKIGGEKRGKERKKGLKK